MLQSTYFVAQAFEDELEAAEAEAKEKEVMQENAEKYLAEEQAQEEAEEKAEEEAEEEAEEQVEEDDLVEDVIELIEDNGIQDEVNEHLDDEPETFYAVQIFDNGDCTGDSLPIELPEGQDSLEYQYWTHSDINKYLWDKGESVIVEDGYRLTVWQHPYKTGQSEVFETTHGECQRMSDALINQMSHLQVDRVQEV